MLKIRVFGHFLKKYLLKLSNFMHNGRTQCGALFEYDAISVKYLNSGLMKGLNRNEALFRSFFIEIS